jgi:hypothetical protein
MTTITTNLYQYKPYLQLNSKKPQTQNSEPPTQNYGSKKGTSTNSNKEKKNKTKKFEEILLDAIDEGLSLLGESAKEAVYFHLEKTFKISKTDIPYRMEEFTDAIEKLFGEGSKILEIHIMKCLFKKVNNFKHSPKQKNLTFTEYVEAFKLKKDNIEKQCPNHKQNGKRDKTNTNSLEEPETVSNWISRVSDFGIF